MIKNNPYMKRPRTESTIGFSLNSSNEVKASLNPLNNDESECLTDFMSCKSSSVTTPSDLNSNRPNKSNNALDSSKLSMSSGHRPPTRLVHKVTPNASESASALVIAASDKAGMDGIDRETIDRIILEESGDSLFMQQQRRRDEKVNEKIRQLVIKLEQQNKQSHDWKYKMEHMIDTTIIPKLLSSRPIRSCKVVVDMDMFYMACELLNRPKLKAINNIQPACVGGESMITTSNYAARRYGVRAAMPGYIAKKLVDRISNGKQQLVFCELNFDLYRQKSKQVMLLLKQYDPFCKSYSLDEAYMDIGPYLACKLTKMNNNETWNHMIIQNELESCLDTGTLRNNNITKIDTLIESCHIETHSHHQWNDPNYVEEIILGYSPKQCLDVASDILNEMREHVYQVTGLTCSAGLATNFLLAKIGSDYNKPNGQKIIDANHDSITEFLYPLSIRKICGIGRVTEKILKSFGILTVQDLYQHRALVHFLFQTSNNNNKDSQAFFLLNASIGCSSSDDCSNKDLEKEDGDKDNDLHQKGISRERSFQSGKSWASIMIKLEEIAQLLSQDMQRKHLFAHTISLKVKLHSFDCLSRARTMPTSVFIQSPKELMEEANKLLIDLRKEYMENTTTKTFSIRLIGIRCNNFKGHDEGAADQNGGVKQINLDRFFNTPCSTTRTENYQLQQSEQNQLEMMKPMESTTRNPYMDKKRNLIKSCDGKLEGRKGLETCTNERSLDTMKFHENNEFERDFKVTVTESEAESMISTVKHVPHCSSGSPALISNLSTTCNADVIEIESDSSSHDDYATQKHHIDTMIEPSTKLDEYQNEVLISEKSSTINQPCFIHCPVCHIVLNIDVNNDQAINKHIDSCLSGKTVKQIICEDKRLYENSKKRRIMDYFHQS